MEGVIDLVDVFGELPDSIYLAAVAYQTEASGRLAAQAPEGNSDGDLDPDEFMQFPVDALKDSTASGTFDRLDPGRGFRVRSIAPGSTANELMIPVVPGQSYRVLSSSSLGIDAWEELTRFTAQSGEDEVVIKDTTHGGEPKRFYRIETQ